MSDAKHTIQAGDGMKAVLLAGGLGTRLSEETGTKPKPMVEVGDRPILWHIMSSYAAHGITDFIVCGGYKATVIKDWFASYATRYADITFDLSTGEQIVHRRSTLPWKVTVVDTGSDTMTGGRLKRVREFLDDEPFCFTYGDGVGNVDIPGSIAFHREQGKLATMTVTQPPGRFGAITLGASETTIEHFREKPEGDGAWINCGFFVLDPGAIDYVDGDSTVWEQEPLQQLALDGELNAWKHDGFWQPMDTLNDRNKLEKLWASGSAPWKIWDWE